MTIRIKSLENKFMTSHQIAAQCYSKIFKYIFWIYIEVQASWEIRGCHSNVLEDSELLGWRWKHTHIGYLLCLLLRHCDISYLSQVYVLHPAQYLTFVMAVKFWAIPDSTSYVLVLVLLVSKQASSLWFVLSTVTIQPDVISTEAQLDLLAHS